VPEYSKRRSVTRDASAGGRYQRRLTVASRPALSFDVRYLIWEVLPCRLAAGSAALERRPAVPGSGDISRAVQGRRPPHHLALHWVNGTRPQRGPRRVATSALGPPRDPKGRNERTGPRQPVPHWGPPHDTRKSNTHRGFSGIFESTGLDICPNLMGRMGPNEPVGSGKSGLVKRPNPGMIFPITGGHGHAEGWTATLRQVDRILPRVN
jgi:hypothetical protein